MVFVPDRRGLLGNINTDVLSMVVFPGILLCNTKDREDREHSIIQGLMRVYNVQV